MRNCQAFEEPAFELKALTARDPRSDDAARRIAVDRHQVSIARRYKGIDMRLAIPVAAYHGLTITAAEEGGYEIHLVHRDADLSVPLHRTADGEEASVQLHAWAELLALPALDRRDAAAEMGVLALLRRDGPPGARRPRFLVRRKAGRIEQMYTVHRGEREIIARE